MLSRTQPAKLVPSIWSTVRGPGAPGADSVEMSQTTQQAFRPPSTEEYGLPPHLERYCPSAVLPNSGETRARATDTRQAATSSLDWDPYQVMPAPPQAVSHHAHPINSLTTGNTKLLSHTGTSSTTTTTKHTSYNIKVKTVTEFCHLSHLCIRMPV